MTERAKKYFVDVNQSAALIFDFIKDINSFNEYVKDVKTKSAVERHLVIIGEAINKLDKEHSETFPQTQKIISFRNRLVHSYDSIDDTIVWDIIKNYLPKLKQEVQLKLDKLK